MVRVREGAKEVGGENLVQWLSTFLHVTLIENRDEWGARINNGRSGRWLAAAPGNWQVLGF
jgi:hypothetical protein